MSTIIKMLAIDHFPVELHVTFLKSTILCLLCNSTVLPCVSPDVIVSTLLIYTIKIIYAKPLRI